MNRQRNTRAPRTGRTVLVWMAALVVALSVLAGTALPAYATAPAPDQSTATYEIKFMQRMIDHHQMAVMTATMCLEEAVHEELRVTCEQIVATQSQEIETMQMWLQDWYGIPYEPAMSPSGMRTVERLAALEGEEFEIAFMEMMIRHHEGAIKEASKCLQKAYHEELLSMCEAIIDAQQAEIEQMEAWLSEWYGR
jgi:uncharacterized protein (DUF305 family)